MRKLTITLFLLASHICFGQNIIEDTVHLNRASLLRSYDGADDGNSSPNSGYIVGQSWTNGGIPTVLRTLFDFDWTALPDSAIILNATLTLHPNPMPNGSFEGHRRPGGSNSSIISSIVEQWDENTVTWDSAPLTGSGNSVILPQSDSAYQSYYVDMTGMVQDVVNDKSNNFGFHFRLIDEVGLRSMPFVSSYHPNNAIHPTLVVQYQTKQTTSISEEQIVSFKVFPNPAKDFINIKPSKPSTFNWTLINQIGEIVKRGESKNSTNRINLNGLTAGVYHLNLEYDNSISTEKIVIQ